MPSKYKIVNGKSCEVELLDLGEQLTRDAPLDIIGARKIWENALDGNKVTERERNSIEQIMHHARHGLTREALEFFTYWLAERYVSRSHGAQTQLVGGFHCDKVMIQVAEHYRRGGRVIGIRGAEGIWFSALDGRGVTNREKRTLEIIFRLHDFDDQGRKFLQSKLSVLSAAAEALAATSDAGQISLDAIILHRSDAIGMDFVEASAADPLGILARGMRFGLQGLSSAARSGFQGIRGVWNRHMQRWKVRGRAEADDQKQETDERPAKRRRCDSASLSRARLRSIFDQCDLNKDGKVNKRELIKTCRASQEVADVFDLPMQVRQEDGSRTKVEEFFQSIDTDGDREISWDEFLTYWRSRGSDV
eukprot:TRINITY_DN16839_c0_g3_i1.p1 TRINITY_DN16839_c0_g3~~TRINITY_DN16839_c0_g3_i1.p1  ORF type:complete len:377 (-),score=62.18 TRINITY_DN16839_c0_g3_i1:258-1346(-)